MGNKKKSKLFGLFNLLDIFIVLVIVVALIIGVKIIKSNSNNIVLAGVGNQRVEYVINAQDVLLTSIEKVKIGDEVYKSEDSKYLGTVVDIKYEKYKKVEFDPSTGKYKEYEVEDKYSLFLTIKGNASHDDRDIIVEGEPIKIGRLLNIKGKGYVFISYVVGIELK